MVVGVSASAAGLTIMPLTLGLVVVQLPLGADRQPDREVQDPPARRHRDRVRRLLPDARPDGRHHARAGDLADDHPRHRDRARASHLHPGRAERGEPSRDRGGDQQQPVLPADRLHGRASRCSAPSLPPSWRRQLPKYMPPEMQRRGVGHELQHGPARVGQHLLRG